MDDNGLPDGIEVEISGLGHHDRAERAGPIVAAIAALGLEVSVRTDLRPRLADDIRSLLEAGAAEVQMEAEGLIGEFVAATPVGVDRFAPLGRRVVVVLRAGPPVPLVVRGEGEMANDVRAAVEAASGADIDGG